MWPFVIGKLFSPALLLDVLIRSQILRVSRRQPNCPSLLIVPLTPGSERTGEPESLRFPAFHSEILKQSHWDAGESYGRIKIVIAEGLSREVRATDSETPVFERFRDVVGFAFQHAPLSTYE
jgi:hypothetical protein